MIFQRCSFCSSFVSTKATNCSGCGRLLSPHSSGSPEREIVLNEEFQTDSKFRVEIVRKPKDSEEEIESLCVKCGKSDQLRNKTISKYWVSPLFIFGFFVMGFLILFFRNRLTAKYLVNAPWCERCWGRVEYTRGILNNFGFILVGATFLSYIFAIVTESPRPAVIIFSLFAIGFLVILLFLWASYPSFSRVTKEEAVLFLPDGNEIPFTRANVPTRFCDWAKSRFRFKKSHKLG